MIYLMILMLLFSSALPVSADIQVNQDVSLESQQISEDVPETGLRFTDLCWSDDQDNFFEYVPNQGVFKRGTRAYAYLEVAGFTNYYEDDKYHIDLTVDIYLKSSFGLRLFAQRNVIEFKDTAEEFIEEISFYLYVDIPRWAPRAQYTAEIVIRDLVNGEELNHEEKLTVR
ncbi:MAG: hypothetical protein GX994_01090 [Firmicutes bacterium]|nr:hypothetical protein [Bacillota bacterium]